MAIRSPVEDIYT